MLWRDTVLNVRSEIVKKEDESLLMRRRDPRKTQRMREVSDSGPSLIRRRSWLGDMASDNGLAALVRL